MRAGFEIEVKRAAARGSASLLERQDFSVFYALVSVATDTDFAARGIEHDGSHCWIRRYESDARSRRVERPPHVLFVDGHWGRSSLFAISF